MSLPHPRFGLRRSMLVVAAVVALGVTGWLLRSPAGWPPRAILRGPGDTCFLAFTPDGKALATAGSTGVTLWDTGTGRPRSHWADPAAGHTTMGAFSPDGRSFATVSSASPGSPLSVELRESRLGAASWRLPTRHLGAYAILFRQGGRQVRAILGAGGSTAGEVIDVEAASGRELARRPFAVPGRPGGSAISPDGRHLARAQPGTCSVTLWDLEADRERAGFLVSPSGLTVTSVGFSRAGSCLGVGLSDGSIELWDLSTLGRRGRLIGHRAGVHSAGLVFSPDDRALASWGTSGPRASPLQGLAQFVARAVGLGQGPSFEVAVLDVATGGRVGLLGSALHPSFSPDGRTLAVRDTDLAVKLLDSPEVGPSIGQPSRATHP